MASRRCSTADAALALVLPEDEDDFFGLGQWEDSESSVDGEGEQGLDRKHDKSRDSLGGDAGVDAGDGDWESGEDDHFLDHQVSIGDAAGQYLHRSGLDGHSAGGNSSGEDDECAADGGGVLGCVCGCSANCLTKLDVGEVEQSILNMCELEKDESNVLMLGILESLRHNANRTSKGKKRKRERFSYSFQGISVCVGAFRLIYDMGRKHFENLSHLEKHDSVPGVHGEKTKARGKVSRLQASCSFH